MDNRGENWSHMLYIERTGLSEGGKYNDWSIETR